MRLVPAFNIRMKIAALLALMIGAVAFIAWLGMEQLERSLMAQKQRELHSQVDVALSLVSHEMARHKKGEIDLDTAKNNVRDALRPLRFADNEYFFIFDLDGNGVMHPIRKDLEGKNLMGLRACPGTRRVG
jgi:methyl-accepting chemotaxis protein